MGYIRVAGTSEIEEGAVRTVETPAGRLALTRLGNEILAFEDVCTHDDGPLAGGTIVGEVVTCPRHGAQFNVRTGAVLRIPATQRIETYPVRVVGSDVEVDLT